MSNEMTEEGLSSRVIAPGDLSPGEFMTWDNLCSSVPSLSSPFLSPHYAHAVAESGVNVRVCVIYRAGRICGFFPYQYRNRLSAWARSAEPVGAEMTDYFGLVAEPGFRITQNQLLKLAHVNHLGFSHLDESQISYGLTGEQPRVGLRARLDLHAECPLNALIAARHKYLKDSERCERRLSSEVGPIEFNLDIEHDRRETLQNLINQKRAQYKRTQVPDALGDFWKTRFLHKLSEYKFESCRGLLSTLSVGGQLIASHFGIAGNGVFQYWFPVYDPAFAKYAPGRLLLHYIIEASRTLQLHTIDHGEGDSASKRELANEEHQYYRGDWHNKSLASHVTRGYNSLKWRLGI